MRFGWRVVQVGACAVLVVAGLPGVARAAAAAPRISVPARTGYWRTVDVEGSGGPPGGVATVGFRRVGASRWTEHDVRVDSGGAFALGFPLSGDTEVRARVGSAASPVDTVRIVRATCRTSGPAFSTFPIAEGETSGVFAAFASFSATRGDVWAGVATSTANARFAVITWRPGEKIRVHDVFDYHKTSYQHGQPGSVNIVGVGAQGQVVVAAQDPASPYVYPGIRFHGYLYGGVHRTTLAASPRWSSVYPTGMADDGTIVGDVEYLVGKQRGHAVVAWTAGGTHVRVVRDNANTSTIDHTGDIAYVDAQGYSYVVVPGGTARPLAYQQVQSAFASTDGGTHTLYGFSGLGPTRWDVDSAGYTAASAVSNNGDSVYTVGLRDDLVLGSAGRQRLVTRSGALVPLPHQLSGIYAQPGVAVDEGGRVAYTQSDHRPHILTCT